MNFWSNIALLYTLVFVISSWLAVRWVRKRSKFVSMMDAMPHSKGHFLLRNLKEFMVSRVELFESRTNLSRRFKNELLFCYWVGPSEPVVELIKAEAVQVLLGSNYFITKSKFHRFLKPWLGNGLLLSAGSEWTTRRKTLTPSFHFKILNEFVDIFNEQAIILVSKMDPHAVGNKSFDVYPLLSLCALDIICETAMQKSINSQGQGTFATEYVNAVNSATNLIMERATKPWLYFDWLFALSPIGKTFEKNITILHGFTDKVIAERCQENEQSKTVVSLKEQVTKDDDLGAKKKLAFLDTLLNCSENGQKLHNKAIRSEVDTFMFAGHDTTSCGIAWTLFLLGHNRSIQDKVHNQLDAIFGGSKRNLTSSDLNEMKYLECVIKESLRLYPPVPYFGRLIDKDMHIAGHDIPGGAQVMVNPYMLHRDPRYFPEPEAFDPDRFLPDNSSKRPLYSYIPFSAGSRNCIGQKYALMEMKIILAHILHQFQVTSMEKREDLKLLSEVILRPANGLWVKLEKR